MEFAATRATRNYSSLCRLIPTCKLEFLRQNRLLQPMRLERAIHIAKLNGVGEKRHTKIIEKSLEPAWNEEFVFNSPSTQRDIEPHFYVRIYDKDLLGDSELLGNVIIPLNSFYQDYCASMPSSKSGHH